MKIAVAMSGGVDSSVAAKILKDEDHEIVGLFLKLWNDPTSPEGLRGASPKCSVERENRCCNYQALEDARKVAAKLNIPFYVINAKDQFKRGVVDYFLAEYKNLRTPNPCIVCNEKIKFDLLLKKALAIGCNFLATGHYAKIIQKSKCKNQNDNSKCKIEYHLLKGGDETKDQSYMLYRLNQNQLSKVLFPLGEMKKSEVRKLAVNWNLPVKEKPESQEICFFADKDYRAFLRRYLPKKYFKPGDIVDAKGNIIGKHDGLLNYTIGQRKLVNQELGIMNYGNKKPLYVIGFDEERNQIIVGNDEKVYKKKMVVSNLNFIHNSEFMIHNSDLLVKIRYHHPEIGCEAIEQSSNRAIQVVFAKKQRAITPGQSAVFYCGDEVLGGGIIQ